MSPKFRFKDINETRNCFLEEIEKNELMSKNHKKDCATLYYIEHVLILAYTITGCTSMLLLFYLVFQLELWVLQ